MMLRLFGIAGGGAKFDRAISRPTGGYPLRRVNSPEGLRDTANMIHPYLV